MSNAAKMRRRYCGGCGCLTLLAGLGLFILLGLIAFFFWQRSQVSPGKISVQIRLPTHGRRLPALETQLVVLQAYNIKSVARYELWVNGILTSIDLPGAGEAALPTNSRLAWRPGQAGLFTLIGRAYDAQGRGGMSVPVVVEALEEAKHCYDGLTVVQVEVKEGDTLESIAALSGSDVECIREANPVLSEPLEPGTTLDVPVPPESLPPEFASEPPEEIEPEPPPEEGLPAAPLPPGQGEGPAQPGGQPGGFGPGGGTPPAAPADLQAEHTGECNVQLRWTDVSDDETSFRIYRMSAAEHDFHLIEEIAANQDLAILVHDDIVPVGGQYQYSISALNAGGEAPGPIALVDVPRDSCFPIVPMIGMNAPVRLQFEATSLFSHSEFDGAHCYLSLATLEPHTRLPESDDLEFVPQDGGWNIADHAAGFRRFTFMQDPEAPVPVEIECWGRRGREHAPLGTWRASHGPEEWDGRALNGETEGFRVTYHISPFINEPGFRLDVIDPAFPVPRNLAALRDLGVAQGMGDCWNHLNYAGGNEIIGNEAQWGFVACVEIWEQMLVWEWSPSDVISRSSIDGFRIVVHSQPTDSPLWGNPADMPFVTEGEVGSVIQVLPVPLPSCGQTYVYQVQAFITEERGGRLGARQSNWSEPLYIEGPMCPSTTVEFILEELWVGATNDSVKIKCEYVLFIPVFCWPEFDPVLEGFGNGAWTILGDDGSEQDGPKVYFWSMRQRAALIGGGYFGPAYRKIRPGRTYNLADEDMAICDPGLCFLGPGNNRTVLTVKDGDKIDIWFWLQDDDPIIRDIWCGTEEDLGPGEPLATHDRKPFQIGPFSTSEWSEMDRTFQFDNSGYALSDQDAECRLTVRVRGLGGSP